MPSNTSPSNSPTRSSTSPPHYGKIPRFLPSTGPSATVSISVFHSLPSQPLTPPLNWCFGFWVNLFTFDFSTVFYSIHQPWTTTSVSMIKATSSDCWFLQLTFWAVGKGLNFLTSWLTFWGWELWSWLLVLPCLKGVVRSLFWVFPLFSSSAGQFTSLIYDFLPTSDRIIFLLPCTPFLNIHAPLFPDCTIPVFVLVFVSTPTLLFPLIIFDFIRSEGGFEYDGRVYGWLGWWWGRLLMGRRGGEVGEIIWRVRGSREWGCWWFCWRIFVDLRSWR